MKNIYREYITAFNNYLTLKTCKSFEKVEKISNVIDKLNLSLNKCTNYKQLYNECIKINKRGVKQ